MYIIIVLDFGILRMSALFVSSYCDVSVPLCVCYSPGCQYKEHITRGAAHTKGHRMLVICLRRIRLCGTAVPVSHSLWSVSLNTCLVGIQRFAKHLQFSSTATWLLPSTYSLGVNCWFVLCKHAWRWYDFDLTAFQRHVWLSWDLIVTTVQLKLLPVLPSIKFHISSVWLSAHLKNVRYLISWKEDQCCINIFLLDITSRIVCQIWTDYENNLYKSRVDKSHYSSVTEVISDWTSSMIPDRVVTIFLFICMIGTALCILGEITFTFWIFAGFCWSRAPLFFFRNSSAGVNSDPDKLFTLIYFWG